MEVSRWINASMKLFSKLSTVFSKFSSSAISVMCCVIICQSHRGVNECHNVKVNVGSNNIKQLRNVIETPSAVGENCVTGPKRCQSANVPITGDINATITEDINVPVTEDINAPITEDINVPVTEDINVPVTEDINYSALRSSMVLTISGHFSIGSCLKTSSRLQGFKSFQVEK